MHNRSQQRRKVASTNHHYRQKEDDEKEKKKGEIIDSHLPFFKCKLEKTEYLLKRPDFRVKNSRFRLNHNVVESNMLRRYDF